MLSSLRILNSSVTTDVSVPFGSLKKQFGLARVIRMSSRGRGRLPSLKGKRDLTLGAAGTSKKASGLPNLVNRNSSGSASSTAEKKKFVPNLNVQRKVKSEEAESAKPPNAKASKWKSPTGLVKNANVPVVGGSGIHTTMQIDYFHQQIPLRGT